MSLRTQHRKNKIVADISSIDDRSVAIGTTISTVFSDLVKVQSIIDTRPFFNASERTEIQAIIDETYKLLWDQAVSRTPLAIKDTNRV